MHNCLMTINYFSIIGMITKYMFVLYKTFLLTMIYCRCVGYESNGFHHYSEQSAHLLRLRSSSISLTGEKTNYL